MQKGSNVLKNKIPFAPTAPGIYMMLNENSEVLYIGKAKNIQNRLSQYLNPPNNRISIMVAQIADIRFVQTKTENEALLLEMSNIKAMKPKYNVLLKDGKTFPEVMLSTSHKFPAIKKHRGVRGEGGKYFGPFASSDNVYQTIDVVRKFFQIRNCSDNDFTSRSRPCIQYQIKRCTAPCVGKVTEEEYAAQVKSAIKFLSGKTSDVHKELARKMEICSDNMEFEKAAQIRDTIAAITSTQMENNIQILQDDDMDIIGISTYSNITCLHIFFIRNGYNCGNKPYFFSAENESNEILYQFVAQFYSSNQPPKTIFAPQAFEYAKELAQNLKTKISTTPDKRIKNLLELANTSALNSAKDKSISDKVSIEILQKMSQILNLPYIPTKIEVFDNSHISGTNAIGAMIVATQDGFDKSQYKKFNFRTATPGDDYSMMHEMLTRRILQIKENITHASQPENQILWLVDGGPGHVSIVNKVIRETGILIPFICIAKGENRNAGMETIYTPNGSSVQIDRKSDVMYYLQRLRDEAHRFAITTHRKKRDKDTLKSALDEINGIGVKRKKALLQHFGSAKLIAQATVQELIQIDGINKELALKIHETLKI